MTHQDEATSTDRALLDLTSWRRESPGVDIDAVHKNPKWSRQEAIKALLQFNRWQIAFADNVQVRMLQEAIADQAKRKGEQP